MSEKQTEAQRLADWLESAATVADMGRKPEKRDKKRQAANELRRLDAENEALRNVLRYIANVGEPWQRDYLIREIQAAAEAALLGKDSAVIAKDTSR